MSPNNNFVFFVCFCAQIITSLLMIESKLKKVTDTTYTARSFSGFYDCREFFKTRVKSYCESAESVDIESYNIRMYSIYIVSPLQVY